MAKNNTSEGNESTKKISFQDHDFFRTLCGQQGSHLKIIERKLGVSINTRGTDILLQGGDWDVELAEKALKQLYDLIKNNCPIYGNDVEFAIRILSGNRSADIKKIFMDSVFISSQKKNISPKSIIQKEYIDGIRNFDIVFGIGPAGTGKTYLAMAMAISCLLKKEINPWFIGRKRSRKNNSHEHPIWLVSAGRRRNFYKR